MASKKQFEANRRNAKKSTGPKSEQGKERSSMNAIKHGLTSRRVWLDEEDGERFRAFRIDLCMELGAEGELEAALVFRVAAQLWRLARVPAIEAELFERLRLDVTGTDEGLAGAWLRDGAPYEGALARLARYEASLERSVNRLMGELRKVQAERRRIEAQARPATEEEAEAIRSEREAWSDGTKGTAKQLAGEQAPPRPPYRVNGKDVMPQGALPGGMLEEELLRNEANPAT